MLAKNWKVILLIICVVAILFNIIYKIVRAPSLQKNLKALQDQNYVYQDTVNITSPFEKENQDSEKSSSEDRSEPVTNNVIETVEE
ncbi:MAG: hypothetical protein IKN74_03930 [Clostridia bacterium]|nr:hypothetical protein [Clostridia bacterium]